jgi:hypothetical protein
VATQRQYVYEHLASRFLNCRKLERTDGDLPV